MGKIYWRKEENDLLLANPEMATKELAVLIAGLGFRSCTAEDVKSRRKRIKGPQPKKPPAWTAESVETLKKHWEVGSNAIPDSQTHADLLALSHPGQGRPHGLGAP
jgi:hypothetical protein